MRTNISVRPIGFLAQDQLSKPQQQPAVVLETLEDKVKKAKDGYQMVAVTFHDKEHSTIYYMKESIKEVSQLTTERIRLNFLDKMYGLTIEEKTRVRMVEVSRALSKQKATIESLKQFIV